ncbi:PDZ domain-containing protein [Lysobacter sp. CFH 32150]|uniref:PDZ domain-containing protein n=1 Tax=Lysobacter sp. CFH 32150 TaxID=2927128 RepID=UPI00272D9445|nr:PDZ domain-containing protein [Lysobacter sp. CFH 32150]
MHEVDMKSFAPKPAALGLALALLLGSGIASAQTPTPKPTPKADAAAQSELDAARRDLDRAARRVAELSHQLGHEDEDIRRVERRMVRKPVIGVLLAPDERAGVRIAGVTPDSAAAKAGLRSGERIVSINGVQVLGSDGELRVENARKLLGNLDTRTEVKLVTLRDGKTVVTKVTPTLDRQVAVMRRGAPIALSLPRPLGIDPDIRTEIITMGPEGHCRGDNCKVLAEAFRWNGLNLASIDPKLGRYFGTTRGVLVLSTGPDLAGLQAGDVIHKVDGKTVNSPRETMAALRGKPADSLVAIDYLRDRKSASTKLKVPKALPRIPLPPTPPAPPVAPRAPAPPPPPPGTAFEHEIILNGEAPAMAFAPEAPLPPEAPEIIEIQVEAR